MNYEDFEGKVIDVRFNDGIDVVIEKGRIVGCDPDIGITIVRDNEPDYYLYCLRGPSSPQGRNLLKRSSYTEDDLYRYFEEDLAQIRKGLLDVESMTEGVGGIASKNECGFGA